MDVELLNLIVANIPNFVGFALALLIANDSRRSEKERADRLLQEFIDCQNERIYRGNNVDKKSAVE